MEGREKPRPGPDYLMQLMNDKKLMSGLPNFCGIFQHLERLLDEGETHTRARGFKSKEKFTETILILFLLKLLQVKVLAVLHVLQ